MCVRVRVRACVRASACVCALLRFVLRATLIHPLLTCGVSSVALHSETFQQVWQSYVRAMSPEMFIFITAGVMPSLVYWVNGLFLLLLELKWPNAQLQRRIDEFRAQYKVQKGKFLNVVLDGPEHRSGELRVLHVVKNLVIGSFKIVPAHVLQFSLPCNATQLMHNCASVSQVKSAFFFPLRILLAGSCPVVLACATQMAFFPMAGRWRLILC